MARTASQRHVSGVAKTSAVGATSVMALAMLTSYGAQRGLLQEHGLGWASWLIPFTVDVLAVLSNLALTLPRREGHGRGGLWFILVLTLAVSSVANWMSGHGPVASTAHVWVVVAYFLAEYIVNWVRSYRAAWETEIEEAETAKQVAASEVKADDAKDPRLPAAPTSPATTSEGTYLLKNGKRPSERHERRLRTGK